MYQNAKSGIGKIFIAQILSLICVPLAFAFGLIAVYAIFFPVFATVAIITIVLLYVLIIAAFVLNLLGIITASKDNYTFHDALVFTIIGVIISVISNIIKSVPLTIAIAPFISLILSFGNAIVSYFATKMIVCGCIELSPHFEKEGNSVVTFALVVMALSLISGIISVIPDVGTKISGFLGIVNVIISIIYYVKYLIFLNAYRKYS